MRHLDISFRALLVPFIVFFLLTVGMCLIIVPGAQADERTDQLRQQLNATYQQVLKNPGDRALTLQYTSIALQLKDYEAAIPPLERILMSEPDNAKIKLQVGILYQSLGSKLMAKQYFMDAKNTPGITPELAKEAEGRLRGL